MAETCRICGNEVRVMTYKFSGLCSQRCEKQARKERDDR